MISNNTSYKLKAARSARDINDYENNHSNENSNSSVDGDQDNNPKYGYGVRESRFRGDGRSRLNDFRARGADRRNFRGRGALPSRRSERDDFYILNRKYQDAAPSSHHGKFYEPTPDKKPEIKLNLPEDTRISKLLRRLSTEAGQENSLAISKKLLQVLLLPDNALYVRKAFHILGESMYDILRVSPGPLAKHQAARALGRMGYILGQENDFDRYQTWLFLKLKNTESDEIQLLLIKSFKETLAFEKNKPVLQEHARNLIHNLVAAIEITENAPVFKMTLDVLVTTVELYPDCFFNQFQDTVDLLFGWHVDHTQPLENIEFISRNLQRIAQHFQCNLKFSVSLIENFLEDITNYSSQLVSVPLPTENNASEHVAVLVLALNTVLKCLGDSFRPQNNKHATIDLISTCLAEMIKTSNDVLETSFSDNIIIATNESIAILLSHLDNKPQALNASIYALIDLQISLISSFSDATIVSMLLLISKVTKELSANLPLELIEKLIGPSSEIVKLQRSEFKTIQDAVICVYQALLNLKNVSLLQEAYRYVLGDLETCYRAIVPGIEPFIQNNPFKTNETCDESSVLFLLRCISQLANASSIIVMWALKPSILELVGVHLRPFDTLLGETYPTLQFSLLYLLYSHCKCYNHFISSSNLVAHKQESLHGLFNPSDGLNVNDVPNTSPNLGNFEIILNILYRTLSIRTSDEVRLLLLQWLGDILVNAESYLASLYDNEQFAAIIQVLVAAGYTFNNAVALSVCDNLEKLLKNKQLKWKSGFYVSVCDLCKLQMGANAKIRARFADLLVHIPWDIAIVELNKSITSFDRKKSIEGFNNYTVWVAQHKHLSSTRGELATLQFKVFMDYLLKNEPVQAHFLDEIFINSSGIHDDGIEADLVLGSNIVLSNWVALESAQFCVNNKLRTPLGKATDTFTKIEGALNQLGNALINYQKNKGEQVYDINRVRVLLQFIEHLEKAIYNASEGTALAMAPAPKLVRSFFITNAKTCVEWLSRLRMVVIHVAMHAGDFGTAVRHGYSLLGDFLATERTKTVEFERSVIFVTLALLSMRETKAIWGLYVWCKVKAGRKFLWIKYAADQAFKKYEMALDGYKELIRVNSLNESGDHKLESDTRNFIEDQIVVCFKELGNTLGIVNWNADFCPKVERGYWFSVTDWKTVENLFNIKMNNHAMLELSTWSYKTEPESWSQYHFNAMIETNLYGIAYNNNLIEPNQKINDNLEMIQSSICDNLIFAPCDHLQNALVMQYTLTTIKGLIENRTSNLIQAVSANFEHEMNKIDSSVLRKVLVWSEFFEAGQETPSFSETLRLDVIKKARKETNYNLAFNHVSNFLNNKQLMSTENGFNNIASLFLQKIGQVPVWNTEIAKAVHEIIKLCYCTDQNRQNIFNFSASAAKVLTKQAEMYGTLELRKISSKILLKLAKWLQLHDEIPLTEINSSLVRHLMVLPEIGKIEAVGHIIPIREMAIGKLLQSSVNQCGDLAKGWNTFGTWCYRWGRKIVDQNAQVHSLTEDDYALIRTLAPEDIQDEDLARIYAILSQTRPSLEEEDIDTHDIHTSEMILTQLRYLTCLANATEDELAALVQIWRNIQKRIYTCYALSADAYFKFLHLSMHSENITRSTESSVITVTLRLLRLIVKYALELQNILEEGLATTPTPPWKVIIPQLFSRLNHPESYVRHRVSDLLCRIAEDAPHLITFPAVVGALEGGLKFDFSEISLPKDCLSQHNECDDDNEEEDNYESDNDDDNALQLCFKTMVDTLSKQDPETISQVQNLVKELRRITLLWDELWLGTLAQHQTEISKRQQQLEYEIEKVNDNINLNKEEKISLIAEKHRIIIKPIVFVLEQLQELTSVEPETPHEKDFQEKYLAEIRFVINKLKNPENPDNPSESLLPLKSLQKQFQQKFHRRAAHTLKMAQISPVLATIKDTLIAMPGLTEANSRVTISHVSNVVSILPTKTKPKKLIFYGSNGQTYTYLFKGLEDLHLDERIMQFLSIANTMMAQSTDLSERSLYRARHYSVIPLGPRSGLISWVDGTTPAFALYKRWQQRELAKPSTKNSVNTTTSVLRPSELFYNKLNPLLKEHGVKNFENRKEWPLSVLKQVLQELMAETPNDLLAKELWCNSISANEWWQVVKRYSYSLAVMSIIGYIIGLGDRHLDNVLVDLRSGEIVHIDYNVCFEKGKTLRVPEKVPFRLTPNIIGALGVTGVEGIFRMACENVLKTMRMGRETLLTLLEAFVYDPLIDWTVGGEVLAGTSFNGTTTGTNSRQSKKDLEKEVTLSMFSVRCTELKVEWEENRDDILKNAAALSKTLQRWLDAHHQIGENEDSLQDLHQQMALVKEAEAANQHPLYNLPLRYEAYCKTQEAMSTARKDIDALIADAGRHMATYAEATRILADPEFGQLIAKLRTQTIETNIFDLVKEFMHNAGKNDVIAQCEQSEDDIEHLSKLQNESLFRCLALFEQYNTMLNQCPKSFIDNHSMILYVQWSKFMLDAKTIDTCDIVYENFREFRDTSHNSSNLPFFYALEAFYNETASQVDKLCHDYNVYVAKEPSNLLDNVYSSAKLGLIKFCANEKGAASAFEFVLANELLLINKNFLGLEMAASRSGDLLIKLTSRDGDWFLDELVLNSKRVVEMINNVPGKRDDGEFLRIFDAIQIANRVYQGLHELHYNFYTIILPETMKKIQSEDRSVLAMIENLAKLIGGLGFTIPQMIGQLEKVLSCLFMQMNISPTYDLIHERVSSMQQEYQSLLKSPQNDGLSQGKMLLMGFNGLFDKLNQEMTNLVGTLATLNIPTSWKKIDQVKEAKSISAHILNPKVHEILEHIFFLKRIQTMSDFFALTYEMCQSFKPNAKCIIFNDEQLLKPVRQFIADFISRQLLGVSTEAVAYTVCFLLNDLGVDVNHEIEQRDIGAESKVPLDDLCQKTWSLSLKQGVFNQNLLSQASTFSANLKAAWEKIQEPKKMQLKLDMLQSSQLRLQNQLTVFSFMYEDISLQLRVRSNFLVELTEEMSNLEEVHRKLLELRDKQRTLVENAFQRLNWAKGANPNVGEMSAAFEKAVSERNARFGVEETVGNRVLAGAKAILRHELLRSHQIEAKEYDKAFLNSFEKWRIACQYSSSKCDVTSPIEESIMALLSPQLLRQPKWMQEVAEIISDLISKAQAKLEEGKDGMFAICDEIDALNDGFREVYNTHCRLMADVKALVKMMTKIEDYNVQTQQFVNDYRVYVENFASLFGKLKRDLNVEEVVACFEYLKYLEAHTDEIYEDLMNLEARRNRPILTRQNCIHLETIRICKQESTTKGQQRNAYAVNVWRRVKMKLEGRDPHPGRKYTPQEQVDYVIREATNLDNLALLYEGWTPWV